MDIDYSAIRRSLRRLGQASVDVASAAQIGDPDTGTNNRGLATLTQAANDCAELIDTLCDRVDGALFGIACTDERSAASLRSLCGLRDDAGEVTP